MDSQSDQNRSDRDGGNKAANPPQNQVPALSAHQIISGSGSVNMLQGRTIRLNLFVQKKS